MTHQVSQFDESSVVITTFIGKVNMTREDVMKAQEQFSLTDQPIIIATLLDGTDCKILLYNGFAKSFMSKQYYLRNISLHGCSNFCSKAKVIHIWQWIRC